MKKLLALILAFLFLFLTSACASVSYRDDLSCKTITDRLSDTLSVSSGYEAFSAEHLRFYFTDTDDYDDHSLIYSAMSEDINEIGVFLADEDEDVEKIRIMCEKYIASMDEEQRAFIASYAPQETTKLDHAEVRVFGRYVIYTILSPSDTKIAHDMIEQMLKK